MLRRFLTVCLCYFVMALSAGRGAESASDQLPVVLLVHGMKVDLNSEMLVWGQSSKESSTAGGTGIIGCLEQAGLPFGGRIGSQDGAIEIPKSERTTSGVQSRPRVFVLEFSRGANVDGLAYKALELAACVRQLKQLTGQRISIVAHSAGGLAARSWLQDALPGLKYHGEVDRLVMISTPHLGSGKAEHWGDFLGTRATSLKPDSELLHRINEELPLPADVKFACVVVRGLAVGMTGLHLQESALTPFVRQERLDRWPLDFLKGTDQVLDVRTQNLRLAKCAIDYESATKRPVVTLLARVPDPTPGDWSPLDLTVHEMAPRHDSVVSLIKLLVLGPAAESPWTPGANHKLQWLDRQLRLHASGVAEDVVSQRHPLSEVRGTRLVEWRVDSGDSRELVLHFVCRSDSRSRGLGFDNRAMLVEGNLTVRLDQFGRPTIQDRKILNVTTQ